MTELRGRRWAVTTSVGGTVAIALGAFWLSFTSLADLAHRSGIGAGQAWAWPLLVDGLIVVATIAVVALDGQPAAWYAWTLLAAGALVSVTANALHAIVAADASVPGLLAAAVAAVPPLVLLASTHLTVVLIRSTKTGPAADPVTAPAVESAASTVPAIEARPTAVAPELLPDMNGEGRDRQVRAGELRERGWSNKRIARELQVHPSTVGRWFARAYQPDAPDPDLIGTEAVMEGVAR